MFNANELTLLNLNYFNQVFCATDVCELISQNGDHWIILKVQYSVPKAQVRYKHPDYIFSLYHRHANAKSFHLHAEYMTILDTVLDIIQHDDYRLKRKGRTFFDDVVDNYSH